MFSQPLVDVVSGYLLAWANPACADAEMRRVFAFGKFVRCRNIALIGRNVWVADAERVQVFSEDGTFLFVAAPEHIRGASGIAEHRHGEVTEVIVGCNPDLCHRSFQTRTSNLAVCSVDGKFLRHIDINKLDTGIGRTVCDVQCDGKGHVYVLSSRLLHVINREGQLVRTLPLPSSLVKRKHGKRDKADDLDDADRGDIDGDDRLPDSLRCFFVDRKSDAVLIDQVHRASTLRGKESVETLLVCCVTLLSLSCLGILR